PKEWEFKKSGDFNGDGKADILWQNTETGDVTVWLMDGVAISDKGYVVMGMPWEWQAK
ncbi:hypothetical protein MBAV_003635, partial [Candidatus Magnetobacterium bavaricum]